MLPAGQQQEVDQVMGDEAEAQDHGTPFLEALACGEREPSEAQAVRILSGEGVKCAKHPQPSPTTDSTAGYGCMSMRLGLQVVIL